MPGPRQDDAPIRVLVVDDSPVVRRALVEYLSEEVDLDVVGACEDGSEVVEAATRLRPDVVFMDLSMPVMDGLQATEALREAEHDAQVIMLTADGSARGLAEAAGARALVPKGTAPARMLQCLRALVRGGDGCCPFCFGA